MTLLLLTLCSLVGMTTEVHADALSSARDFTRTELAPLLRGREKFAKVRVSKGPRGTARVTLQSRGAGEYTITFDPTVEAAAVPAPVIDVGEDNQLRSHIDLPVNWQTQIEQAVANVRRALRADPNLHPTNRPKDAPITASPPQQDMLKALHEHQAKALSSGRAQRSLVLMPPGTGKTVVAGLFAEQIETLDEDVLVVYVVQNNEVLDQATERITDILGYGEDDVQRYYGGRTRARIDGKTRVVATSRTVLHKDLAKFIADTQDRPGRIMYVVDEAHHIGRDDGEFQTILDTLDKKLRPRDILLGLTATPWHTDVGPIQKYFDNNIAATFVSKEELDVYVRTGRFVELSRLIFFRAIAAGYVSSIHEYRRVDFFGPGHHLSRDYLRDSDVQISTLPTAQKLELFRRTTQIHEPFVAKVLEEIRHTIRESDGRGAYYNRGLIFVPSIAHAEAYAAVLSTLTDESDRIIAEAYHSGLDPDERKKRLEWFNAEGLEHKYMIVVDTLGEGYDLPAINHLVLATPYGENDLVGMRRLLQHLGRAARVGSHKTRLWISDFTGDMERLIFSGLDETLVEAAFSEANRPSVRTLLGRIREYVTKFDRKSLKHGKFEASDVTVPMSDLARGGRIERKWSLARLLLDPTITTKLIPHPLVTRGSVAGWSLSSFLCARLQKARVSRFEEEFPMIEALLTSLGLIVTDESTILEEHRALHDALIQACSTNAFKKIRRKDGLSTIPPSFEERIATVEAIAPDVFGRAVEISNADLKHGEDLLARGPLIPWARTPEPDADHAAWQRPWTLAELLLHPSVPKTLGLKAPSLAMMLLVDDDLAELSPKSVEDWRAIDWRPALVRAHIRKTLVQDPASYLFDPGYRRRAVEALTAIDPDVFGQPTAWSDSVLRAHANAPADTPNRRAIVLSSLMLDGHDMSYDESNSPIPPMVPSLRVHNRTVREASKDWTLAQFLLSPIAFKKFLPHPYYLRTDEDRTFARAICDEIDPRATSLRRRAVTDVLTRLGLDRASWRVRGLDAIIVDLCHDGLLDQEVAYTWSKRLGESMPTRKDLEVDLIRLAPSVFGARVRFDDTDAKKRVYPFTRGAVIPFLAPAPSSKRDHDRWSLARVLLDPSLARVIGQKRDTLASQFVRLGEKMTFPRQVRFHWSWYSELPKRLIAAAAHGLPIGPRPWTDDPSYDLEAAVARLIAYDPQFFGQAVDLTNAKLHALLAVLDRSRPNHEALNWNLWRGGIDPSRPPADPSPDIFFEELVTTRGPRVTTSAWYEPWTLARALLSPVNAQMAATLSLPLSLSDDLGVALARHKNRSLRAVTGDHGSLTRTLMNLMDLTRFSRAWDRGFFRENLSPDDEARRRALEAQLIEFDPYFGRSLEAFTDEATAASLATAEASTADRERVHAYLRARHTVPDPPCEGWFLSP